MKPQFVLKIRGLFFSNKGRLVKDLKLARLFSSFSAARNAFYSSVWERTCDNDWDIFDIGDLKK